MKRIILSVVGTVVALVALLSFKTHGSVAVSGAGLPSAALTPSSTSSSPPAPTQSSSAPPDPTATSSSPAASSSSSATKTTVGTAIQTRYGIVQVKVVTSGNKITNVSFAQLTAFDGRSQEINSNAAPILLQETLSAQSANIDGVSGATYTSDGYKQSLQSALDQAGIG